MNTLFFYCTLATQAVLLSTAFAQSSAETTAAADNTPPLSAWLKKQGINAGGGLAVGGAHVFEHPAPGNNTPITFDDQNGAVQLNQFNLFLEHVVDRQAQAWHIGWRVDSLFGTDSRYTQASGLDNKLIDHQDLGRYNLAIPQAYIEISTPFAHGMTAKVGHFYTLIGYEVVTAPNNFFYSHAYTMQYGEPFTHSGVLFSYVANRNVTINSGAVTGWDNFDQDAGVWNFLGNIAWLNDATDRSISFSVISGDVNQQLPCNRSLSSLVYSQGITDKLQYVFQQDFGYQQQTPTLNHPVFWYGVNQYLFYNLSEQIATGIRAEWFRDNNGVRLGSGVAADYVALTYGINLKPFSWLSFRPELRYDYSDAAIKAYANHTKNQQLEIAVDMIATF